MTTTDAVRCTCTVPAARLDGLHIRSRSIKHIHGLLRQVTASLCAEGDDDGVPDAANGRLVQSQPGRGDESMAAVSGAVTKRDVLRKDADSIKPPLRLDRRTSRRRA